VTAAFAPGTSPPSAWAPLRHPLYRALWIAQLASNVGTWMQTVGAQWLMGDLGASPLEVALVQAAVTMPLFLVGLPAGALGDIVDRRRLLILSQSLMLVSAALMAGVAFGGLATPWVLLGLTFVLGAGQALTAPAWQAIVPELVEPREITRAAALAGVNMNVARAVGPAIGGVLVAAAGAEWTFALNAVSFVGVVAVIVHWRRPATHRLHGPEHVGAAIRTGLSYARHAPRLTAVLARAAIFVIFAGSLWAVLPVYVRDDLGLGSGGYGLLLGAVGVGAIAGAVALARVSHLRSNDELLMAASLAFAAACAICALVPSPAAVAIALALAGAAWIAASSSLNGTVIAVLPEWVRSRGTALYAMVFGGGQALSAVLWGVVTQAAGARAALGSVAGGLVVGLIGQRPWSLPAADAYDTTLHPWPVRPDLVLEPAPQTGPILVTVEYRVEPERQEEFRQRMREVGRARRRTGAERWGLFRDGADPDCFLEVFLVATWQEHLRQHGERSTAADRALIAEAAALATTIQQARARHYLPFLVD
jgi:MFS family permease